MPTMREKWQSPMNQAALWALPVAAVAALLVWLMTGMPSVFVAGIYAVIAWGIAIPVVLAARKGKSKA